MKKLFMFFALFSTPFLYAETYSITIKPKGNQPSHTYLSVSGFAQIKGDSKGTTIGQFDQSWTKKITINTNKAEPIFDIELTIVTPANHQALIQIPHFNTKTISISAPSKDFTVYFAKEIYRDLQLSFKDNTQNSKSS